MAAPKNSTVAAAAAQSVQGPTVGFADVTTTTSVESVDLSAWADRYVTIACEDEDHYICFGTTISLSAGAVGTAGIPRRITKDNEGRDFVVPRNAATLYYRAVSGTGKIRVSPS